MCRWLQANNNDSKIEIEYDGAFPNLCSGHLKVYVGNKMYDFGEHALVSGGRAWIDEENAGHVSEGEWGLSDSSIPEDFPKELLPELLEVINKKVEYGCCGGCI